MPSIRLDMGGRAITFAITQRKDIRKSFRINMVHGEGIEPRWITFDRYRSGWVLQCLLLTPSGSFRKRTLAPLSLALSSVLL